MICDGCISKYYIQKQANHIDSFEKKKDFVNNNEIII